MLSIVVAVGNNNVIGKNNSLPWHLPCDLKYFKKITSTESKTIIMGRKTFEALPKILPNRKHIILTKNKNFKFQHPNVEVFYSMADLKPFIKDTKEYFVIGGGEIFSLLLPYTKKIYLTKINYNFEGDTFFPSLNKNEWKTIKYFHGIKDSNNIYDHIYFTLCKIS